MNVVRFIINKMNACRPVRSTEETPDLALYRQLRRTENKLHEARECLNRKLASQQKIVHTCASGVQSGEVSQYARTPAEEQATGLSAPQSDIEHLRHEVARLEAEYQNAQMKVRAYFYLETCPGSLPQNELTAGHPAQ